MQGSPLFMYDLGYYRVVFISILLGFALFILFSSFPRNVFAYETSYETGYDGDRFIGDSGGTEIKDSQGFKVPNTVSINKAELYLKTNGGNTPTDAITVRIETDSSNCPSGSLVDANATGTISAASISSSYSFVVVNFSGSFSLTAATQYHLVLSVTNQNNDVHFLLGDDSSSPAYTDGTECQSFNGGAWSTATRDVLFRIGDPPAPTPTPAPTNYPTPGPISQIDLAASTSAAISDYLHYDFVYKAISLITGGILVGILIIKR